MLKKGIDMNARIKIRNFLYGLASWFNNSFVPQASANLGIPAANFSLLTPSTGDNFDFNLTITQTIPRIITVPQTNTTTTTRRGLINP